MTEPTPEVNGQQPIDFGGLEFSDAPMPDASASADFVSDSPPEPQPGGFRGFASRSARAGARTRKAKTEPKKDFPLLVQSIPNRKGQFVEPLTQIYAGIGTAVIMFDPVCGQAILTSATKCAETIDELAYKNEAVRRAVWALTQTSLWGAVIVAHMPIVMAVVMHHVPAAQQAFGALGANMMEEFLKQTTPTDGEPE